MKIITNPAEFIAWRNENRATLGFVPTMGALHAGHLELLKCARADNELLALSIFVNPTQFNDKKDLQNYPKTWDADLEIAKSAGVDVIFYPEYDSIYPDNFTYVLSENDKSKILCGASRPGHFDGVLTIVMKLLNIVAPNKAYFGEKDFQQLSLIRGMVSAFFMPIEIIGVPIVREADGLALSSRNVHLSDEGRKIAPRIYEIIRTAKTIEIAKQELQDIGFKIDYLQEYWGRRLVAVKTNLTKTGYELRLIDNVEI